MTWRYLRRRLLQLLPTAAGVVAVAFLLIQLAPGEPILALAGQHGDAEYYASMRERFGLDRSLPQQLATYTGRLATGDLGTSYVLGRSVASVIGERIPATLLLTGSALLLSTAGGIAVGVWSATRRGLRGGAVSIASLVVYAAPVFWVGQIGLLLLALELGWFPVQGMTDAAGDASGPARWLDVAHHLALPALVLASQEVAAVARLTRSGMLEELRSDYVRTARAKGLGDAAVRWKHALRSALLPVVTVVGGRVGHLLSGTVVVEIVFGWPGIGRLLVNAVVARDIPVVMGVFLVVAMAVVIANLVTDLVYAWLDPRIRLR